MKNKKILILIITLASGALFLVTLYKVFFYAPTDEIPIANSVEVETADPLSHPILLTIPKIKVKADVQDVGITKLHNMATPDNYTDVGWYKYGIAPGDTGSSVIAGHVDNGLAFPGVFSNLKEVQIGDDVYVLNKGGQNLHFVVSKINVYNYNDRTTDVFTEKDGKLLKLITCTGTWLSSAKTHDQRLVVTAVLQDK